MPDKDIQCKNCGWGNQVYIDTDPTKNIDIKGVQAEDYDYGFMKTIEFAKYLKNYKMERTPCGNCHSTLTVYYEIINCTSAV